MPWRRMLRFSLIYYAIMLIALFAFTFFALEPGPREVPYSEFLRALETKTVAKVQLSDRSVVWTVHDQLQPFISTRLPGIDDATLLAQLRALGAEFGGHFDTTGWGCSGSFHSC